MIYECKREYKNRQFSLVKYDFNRQSLDIKDNSYDMYVCYNNKAQIIYAQYCKVQKKEVNKYGKH